jgi:Bacterial Ig-like domain (DUF1927)./WD40-like Beta Propeller Repeat.
MGRFRKVGVALGVVLATSGCAWVGRVGVSTAGVQPGGGASAGTDVSPNGRYIVFTSDAANLVPGDLNGSSDVFWRDNQTGVTERVSVANNGSEAALGGYQGLVSADGRYVAFSSDSEDIVTGDTNASTDVFLRDRLAGTTIRVSVKNAGGQADGPSYLSSMTPDTKIIVFASDAENLIGTTAAPLDQNFSTDVYIRDRTTATAKTQRISVATDGTEGDLDSFGGSISDDGRYIAFMSNSSNFDINDSGIFTDVFVRDRNIAAPSTTRITALPSGDEADADSSNVVISGDGTVVAFDTDAGNLVATPDGNLTTDVYAATLATGVIERVSVSTTGGDTNDFSFVAGISDDARFVLFQSGAKNLMPYTLAATSNSFVRDRTTGATALGASTQGQHEPSDPDPGLAGSSPNAISGDGRYVLFTSTASDVMSAGDSNGTNADVFLRSNPVPFVFVASPSTVTRGTTVTISLIGSGLHTGSLVVIGGGVTVNNVTFVNQSRLDVNVTVAADAELGARTPYVFDAGTGAGPFTGGLTFFPSLFSVV